MKVLGYSTNLWEYYLEFMTQKSGDLNEIRKYNKFFFDIFLRFTLIIFFCQNRVFERSIQKLGESCNGGSIWKKYIEFETANQEQGLLFNIYQRCIRSPLMNLEELFQMFKDFFANMSGKLFSESLTPEQSNFLDSELQKETKEGEQSVAIEKKKEFFFQNMENVFHHSKNEMEKRKQFETSIKRDYFHVVPLTEPELDVWRQYINFEIDEFEKNNPNIGRVCVVFERCLIPCVCFFVFSHFLFFF